jgi:hypothetical protein
MRSFIGCFALAALAVTASIANADPASATATAPERHGKHHGKVKRAPKASAHDATRKHRAVVRRHEEAEDTRTEDTRAEDARAEDTAASTHVAKVALAFRDSDDAPDEIVMPDDVAPPATLETSVKPPGLTPPSSHDWHVAIGPDAWVPGFVDAKLPGGSSVSGGLGGGGGGSSPVQPHIRFALPLIGEARYHRFSLVVDVLYGAVGVDGGGAEGPVMVTLDGAASYLELDSFLGYRLVGDSRSPFAIELRGGLRYQRAVVAASVGASGNTVASVGLVDATAEALAGARAFVRPWQRLYFSADADVGLFGSNSTWSASAAANLQIGSHVLVSLGARAMSTNVLGIDLVMYGPRAMVEATF